MWWKQKEEITRALEGVESNGARCSSVATMMNLTHTRKIKAHVHRRVQHYCVHVKYGLYMSGLAWMSFTVILEIITNETEWLSLNKSDIHLYTLKVSNANFLTVEISFVND